MASCSVDKTGFIVRHKTKDINLKAINENNKIGYETDSAIIYIGQNDAIDLTEKIISKRQKQFDSKLLTEIQSYKGLIQNINGDTLVQHWDNNLSKTSFETYDLAGFIDQWLLKVLLTSGKSEVWSKSKNRFENEIIYHFVQDQLGGQSCYYKFKNGSEFHRQIIRLGE